jgi:ERO1-like protein alpha
MCAEEQTLYQIISGLHTSISTHITRFYRHFKNKHVISPISPVDDDPAFFFNHTEYAFRVLQFPDRIRNLVFLYRILAKAVKEAAPYLRHSLNIASDNITEDLKSKQLLDGLLK